MNLDQIFCACQEVLGYYTGSEKCMIINKYEWINFYWHKQNMMFPAPQEMLAPRFTKLACSANTPVLSPPLTTVSLSSS